MHHIINNLWLGSQQDADTLIRNNPENITAILNVRGPDEYLPPGRDQSAEHAGKPYKWIPAPDTQRLSQAHVDAAVAWLTEQTKHGHRILIHCMYGISRSPAILAAFMVKSGLSPSLEAAKAAIAEHRDVIPAAQPVIEAPRPAVLVSALTGLPNHQAFDASEAREFVAIINVDCMNLFNESFGQIAGDALLKQLAKVLVEARLDAYHAQGDEFLCKGQSAKELKAKLARASQALQTSLEVYRDGRMQNVEGVDFSFGIGPTLKEASVALHSAKQRKAGQSPEWMRWLIATGGRGTDW